MKKNLFTLGLLTLMLGGCAQRCIVMDSSQQAHVARVGTSIFSTQVTVARPSLHTQGEFYEAGALLTNTTAYDQALRYQFQWQTIEGYAAGEASPWTPLLLSPYREQPISAISPHKNAVHFKIMVCKEK